MFWSTTWVHLLSFVQVDNPGNGSGREGNRPWVVGPWEHDLLPHAAFGWYMFCLAAVVSKRLIE